MALGPAGAGWPTEAAAAATGTEALVAAGEAAAAPQGMAPHGTADEASRAGNDIAPAPGSDDDLPQGGEWKILF
jgi:hypothetical protein